MFEVGRLVVKIAGRDAGKKGVIVEIVDENFVVVDGETRRRKINMKHIEPLKEKIDIKSKASHSDVASAFKKLGIEIRERKAKQKTERPKKQRKEKVKPAANLKPKKAKKAAKKASKNSEEKPSN